MKPKRLDLSVRPASQPVAEHWVRRGEDTRSGADIERGKLYTARITIDVTPELRGCIKIAAYRQAVTVADMLRTLLERSYREGSDIK